MDLSDPSPQPIKPRFLRLLRYYTSLQFHSPSSPYLPSVLGLYSCLQVATFLMPAQVTRAAPWNYAVFWPVWLALNAVARPDQLLLSLAVPAQTVLVCLSVVLATRVVTMLGCFVYLGLLSKQQFRQLVAGRPGNCWGQRLMQADRVSLLVFTWVMWRPAVAFLTSAAFCSYPEACLTALPWTHLLATSLLCLYVLLIALDKVGTCDLQWKANGVSLGCPQQRLFLTILDILTCVLLSFLSFSQSTNYILLFACILGLTKCTYVCRELPFHQHMLNVEASFQGLLLVLQSLLLWVAVFFDESGLMASLSIFVIVPLSVISLDSSIKRTTQACISGAIVSDWQREVVLRQQFPPNSQPSPDPKALGLWTPSSKLQALLWSTYYYLNHNDLFSLKVLISQLSLQKPVFLMAVSFSVCMERVLLHLEAVPEEKVLRDFIELTHQRAKVLTYDCMSTQTLKSFYEKLLHRHVSFQDLVMSAHSLSVSMHKTLEAYKKVLSVFKEKKSMLQAYCSLLETLGNVSEAAKCHKKLAQIVSSPHKERFIEGVDFLQAEDPRSVLLLVQCQGSGAGNILWAENAGCLGYTDESIKGCEMGVIVPKVMREKHMEIIRTFPEKGRKSEVFGTTANVYFASKDNFLIYGAWKLLLTNSPLDGKLAILSVIRRRKCPLVFAFWSPTDGKVLERTKLFHLFLEESNFSLCADYSTTRVWTGTWRSKDFVVRKSEWTDFQSCRFPILVLCKWETGTMVGSGSELNLSSLVSGQRASDPPYVQNFANRIELLLAATQQSNSLFRSSTSSKEVYTRITRKQDRSYFRNLAVTLGALFAVSIVLNVVTVTSISSQNYRLNEDIGEMQALRMRTNSITASMRSKELFLVNNHYPYYVNETKARADLRGIGTQLGEMAGYLMGNSSKQTGDFRKLLLEPVVPFWVHEGDSFTLRYMSLINMMLEVASKANMLTSTPLANITTANSNFMTLYRSGVIEVLEAFNSSVAIFAEQRNEQRSVIDANIQATVISSIVIQITITVGIAVPILVLIEHWRRRLWSLIMQIPRPLLAEMLKRVQNRLENLHQVEEFEAWTANPSKPPITNNHYTMSPEMKKLVVLIAVYAAFLVLSVYSVYYIGVTENAEILINKPKYIHWAGLRKASPWLAVFYLRESYLPFNLSYPAVLDSTQRDFSSPVRLFQALDEFKYIHYCLTYGCPESGLSSIFLSADSRNLLMGTPCLNCSTFIKYGLTPLIAEFVYTEMAAYASVQAGDLKNYSLGKTAEKALSAMAPFLADAVTMYDTETVKMLANAEQKSALSCALFLVAGLLVLLLVLMPLIAQVRVSQNRRVLKWELQVLRNIRGLEAGDTHTTHS